jgi:hypothetical protein
MNTCWSISKIVAIFFGFYAFTVNAENIVIHNPNYFESPIRDGVAVFPDSLCFDSEVEEITFPDMGTFVQLGDYNFPNLRKVTLGNVDYIPGGAFDNMQKLEEIVIDGMVGHLDCAFAIKCPNLKKVVFKGSISSTGGPGFVFDCPKLSTVIFEGSVSSFCLDIYPEQKSLLSKYTIKGAILEAYNEKLTPVTSINTIKKSKRQIRDLENIAKWQCQALSAKGNIGWMRKVAYNDAKLVLPILNQVGSSEAAPLQQAMDDAWNRGDDVRSNLEILKASPVYAKEIGDKPQFVYALPTDSMLTATRLHFNLDSVAGSGDDISKIKNLLYWVHDNIKHDGNNGFPAGARNLQNIYYSSRRNSCGYNCRALAISLTEALLSEGIPARYVTCESKAWDTDYDCHVICVAWSESLHKWIWVDPTFAAYVTDETGMLLHPGEVRYRLQHDLPLELNADANWNHKYQQTKDNYLENYMAKNLYIMSVNMLNQAEPEGISKHKQGHIAALVPIDSNYRPVYLITTDEDWFWQGPNQ